MLSFEPIFSLSSFTFIKTLFSSSSLSAIRVVSSAYLRLLIFLPAILIPACASSSPAFLLMYSAYKLNKQGDNIHTALTYSFPYLEPVCCSMSSSNYCFLTCIQVSQEAGPMVWHSHLFQNFLQFIVIHTVKGFDIVNKEQQYKWPKQANIFFISKKKEYNRNFWLKFKLISGKLCWLLNQELCAKIKFWYLESTIGSL